MYEAKTLFTNIDSIITASTVFSRDLEEMFASGQGAERVGTVCLRHVRRPDGARSEELTARS